MTVTATVDDKVLIERDIADIFYQLQKLRIAAKNMTSHLTSSSFKWVAERLHKIEKDMQTQFKGIAEAWSVYQHWLRHVKGIGPTYAVGMLAWLRVPVSKADTVSQFWTYCGYATEDWCINCNKRYFDKPGVMENYIQRKIKQLKLAYEKRKGRKEKWDENEARKKVQSWICDCQNPKVITRAQKRVKGRMVDWNPRVRVLFWKIGSQLCMVVPPRFKRKGVYRMLYENYKQEYLRKHPEILNEKGGKGHINNMAKHKMVKQFIAHLWKVWRDDLGLPTRSPYIIGKDGHSTVIPPLYDRDDNEGPVEEMDIADMEDIDMSGSGEDLEPAEGDIDQPEPTKEGANN